MHAPCRFSCAGCTRDAERDPRRARSLPNLRRFACAPRRRELRARAPRSSTARRASPALTQDTRAMCVWLYSLMMTVHVHVPTDDPSLRAGYCVNGVRGTRAGGTVLTALCCAAGCSSCRHDSASSCRRSRGGGWQGHTLATRRANSPQTFTQPGSLARRTADSVARHRAWRRRVGVVLRAWDRAPAPPRLPRCTPGPHLLHSPHRAPPTRCTAESVHRVWHRRTGSRALCEYHRRRMPHPRRRHSATFDPRHRHSSCAYSE